VNGDCYFFPIAELILHSPYDGSSSAIKERLEPVGSWNAEFIRINECCRTSHSRYSYSLESQVLGQFVRLLFEFWKHHIFVASHESSNAAIAVGADSAQRAATLLTGQQAVARALPCFLLDR
jgi:hypothetical protein